MDHGFGARLRAERERRKISLESIAVTTKVSASLYKGLERGDVSRWPAGIYRRAFVRAYASAIGLDPEETVREFLELYPEPETAQPEAPAIAQLPIRSMRLGLAAQPQPVVRATRDASGIAIFIRLPHTRLTDAFVRWMSPLFTWLGHVNSESSSS